MQVLKLDFPRLRPAGPDDDTFLRTLFAAARADLAPLAADPALFATLIDMQWRAQRAGYRDAWPAAHDFIVEDDAGAAGRLLVDTGAAAWRIVDLALLPRARGRGHGGAIVRAVQDAALAAGVAVALTVRRDNPGARRLYAALGFTPVAHDPLQDPLAEGMVWRGRAVAT